MNRIELYNHDPDADLVSSFATDAEIEFADQLRHQLEERYLPHPVHYPECDEEL